MSRLFKRSSRPRRQTRARFIGKLIPWKAGSDYSGFLDADKRIGELPGVGLPRGMDRPRHIRAEDLRVSRPSPRPRGVAFQFNWDNGQWTELQKGQAKPLPKRPTRARRQPPSRTAQKPYGAGMEATAGFTGIGREGIRAQGDTQGKAGGRR